MMFRLTVSATREKYLKLRYQYFYLTSADTDTGRYFDGIPTHNYQTTGIRYLSLALCSHKTRCRPVLARDLDLSQYNFAAPPGGSSRAMRWGISGGAVPLVSAGRRGAAEVEIFKLPRQHHRAATCWRRQYQSAPLGLNRVTSVAMWTQRHTHAGRHTHWQADTHTG